MKQEIESKILNLITELESGIDFGKEQAPIIVEQVLRYNTLTASLILLVSLCILIGFSWVAHKYIKIINDVIVPMFFVWVIALVFTIGSILKIAKIYIAPNLYILDYLRSMT